MRINASGLLLIGALFLCLSTYSQVFSDFNSGIESWTATGALGDLVSHVPTGGNPGGYVSATPTWTGTIGVFPVYFYFAAPGKFLGNFSSYYNGNITFDLRQGVFTTAVVRPEVILSDGTTSIYFFPPTPFNPPTTGWTTYSVTLSATSGYWKTTNSDTGPAATAGQILSVLSNITVFGIRGRFNSVASPPATSLDNVVMQPPITITTHPVAQSVCNGTTAALTAAATGNNNITYRWQIFNATAYFDLSNNAVYSGVSTSSLSINTTGMMGAGSYRCRVSGTNATDVFTMAVMVTVNANPSPPGTTGNFSCGSAAVTLSASGGSAGQYRWYTVPTGGTAIGGQTNSAYTTPVISSTTTYYVSINNGTCESARTSVTATINTIPTAPSTSGNSSCGSAAITLNALGGVAGQYRWYTVPTGGTAIGGQTNSAYTTPFITSTTTYYVSIDNGTCESIRIAVVATINAIPTSPNVSNANSCTPAQVTLNASGTSDGNYLWYDSPTGGNAITGEVNSTYTTPVLTTTTDFFVSISNGFCESNRIMVTATIGGSACTNKPPAIAISNQSTTIEGKVTVILLDLISDADDNLDPNSLKIITQPISGADALINNGILTINYSGLGFTGEDKISIEVCDLLGSCSQQEFTIEVTGELQVYNGISPNNDPYNNKWIIGNIATLPDTKSNH
ncbi:MAG TPA: laminin B domain-containing protein [Cyclobacteriaceae bacterium]|nr:laminin B domain-containing protein [Cyclobacteriaceae bacterium]